MLHIFIIILLSIQDCTFPYVLNLIELGTAQN